MKNKILFITLILFVLFGINLIIANVDLSPRIMCYQEFADISTSCGGLNQGSYTLDYSDYSFGSLIIDYKKPIIVYNSSLWRVKINQTDQNFTIPQSCLDYSNDLIFKYQSSTLYLNSSLKCLNNTSWVTIFSEVYSTRYGVISTNNPQLMYDGNWNTQEVWNSGNGWATSVQPDEIYMSLYEEAMWWNTSILRENSQTYNPTTSVINTENFIDNISYDSSSYIVSANFTYNGTTYTSLKTSTGTGALFSNTLGMSNPTGNKSFYWTIYLTNITGQTLSFNSTIGYQVVSGSIFGICNSTNNISYANFTFKDENTGTTLNASMDLSTWYIGQNLDQFIFSNLTLNPSYAFCFSPPIASLQTLLQYFQYSSTGYPQRSYYFSGTLTNATTNNILYLLSSGQGIYSTFLTTFNNQPVPGVTIQVEKQFNGVWILLTQGVTDSAGSVTFYLNPNYQHRVTATKTSYTSTQVLVSPSQSTYTIQMNSASNYTYVSAIDGISWGIFPMVGPIGSLAYNFGFNVSSSKNNLVKCKINLMNGTNIITSQEAIASTSSLCSVSLNFNPTTFGYTKIKGQLLIDIGNGYQVLEGDAYWINLPVNSTGTTLKDFFTSIKNFPLTFFSGSNQTEQEQHREYTMVVLFFFFLMILCAALSLGGWDIQSSGGIIFVLVFLIWMASIPGLLTLSGLSPFPVLDKYFLAITSSLFVGGYILREWY